MRWWYRDVLCSGVQGGEGGGDDAGSGRPASCVHTARPIVTSIQTTTNCTLLQGAEDLDAHGQNIDHNGEELQVEWLELPCGAVIAKVP